MIRDLLLAMGLVLENAAQLHVPGTGLGVGELVLIMWVASTLACEAWRLDPPWSFALSRLLIFWLLFAFAQSIGSLVGLATEEFRDTTSTLRTSIAYVLMATASCSVLILPDTWRRLRRVIWIAVVFGGASVTVLLARAYGLVPLPGIEPWIWSRLRGWSENPNQFAFLCTALALLSLHLVATAETRLQMLTALACGIVNFVGGILTKSDSFILFALIALPFIILCKLWTWLFSVDKRLSLRTAIASLFFLAVPSLLVSAAPFAPTFIDHAQKFAVATMQQNNQAENRFALWREALEIGMEANMLGLGPGPHLVNKQWKRPPPDKFEAHNTLLDLFTQGGLIVVLSFLWIVAAAFLAAFRAGDIALAALMLAIFIFSNFHFNGRQLFLWFAIALCLASADAARAMAPAVERNV
jgi:hypothetical protein